MADHVATPVSGLSREPAAVIATITALVAAVITLLVAIGVDVPDDLRNAILGVVAVLAPIVAGLITRSKVSPASTVVVQSGADGTLRAGDGALAATGSVLPDGVVIGNLAR